MIFLKKYTHNFYTFNIIKQIRNKYNETLIKHFENPKNIGSFKKNEINIGTGLVGAPACGDVMKLQIKVDPRTDVIIDAKFKTFGCGSAIASSEYATQYIINKKLEEALKLTNKNIAEYLKLPPVKLHCSLLAEDAIKKAIKDYSKTC